MRSQIRRALLLAATSLALAAGQVAAADDYPSRPVRIVVPYGAGTGLDVLTRALMIKVGEELKTTLTVENLAGSNGIIGTQGVARAPADGYTLLATTQSHYTSGLMYTNLPYDPFKFIPVARFGQAQLVVVSSPTASFATVQQLVAEAKKQPGKLSFASLGSGSSAHMAGALFNSLAGIDLMHVPYKEASQALTDTIRGEPSINFVAMPTAASQIKAGKLRALAVTGARRSGSLPDVPTVAESGVPDYDMVAWYALLAPEGTPPAVVQKLSAAVSKVTGTAEFRAMLARMGMDPMPDDAKEFAAKLPAEVARWRQVVSLTNAKVN
ncbi:tripartite tricarboxylate transporter substrate binding protein [Ramlibacter algicola]|uniref:Tripartite tricarboxylate transporter substrate binding protein n=1 Tax=Ramlibacter algicola TaxID=2795217 RepID=A0A934UQE7_9BURK|nr:tripartite tricarboxylate transporter substrate binding protein [Ramlibacter algicola]MBK0392559.1 tripartite tricarboxylate transporter substrate binding protein [Ramlibacter algicola]